MFFVERAKKGKRKKFVSARTIEGGVTDDSPTLDFWAAEERVGVTKASSGEFFETIQRRELLMAFQ